MAGSEEAPLITDWKILYISLLSYSLCYYKVRAEDWIISFLYHFLYSMESILDSSFLQGPIISHSTMTPDNVSASLPASLLVQTRFNTKAS